MGVYLGVWEYGVVSGCLGVWSVSGSVSEHLEVSRNDCFGMPRSACALDKESERMIASVGVSGLWTGYFCVHVCVHACVLALHACVQLWMAILMHGM